MKHEWRKKEKVYYIPKVKPEIRIIKPMKFIQMKGSGNPNSEEFAKKVGTLYSLAYGIKMIPKKGMEVEGYFEYTVYPLEGTWDLMEEGRAKAELDKNDLIYTIMIRQPDFVTEDLFENIREIVKSKNENELLDEVEFVTIDEGMCVQMLHVGPFEEERKSFDIMEQFCKENNLNIKSKVHREIYLSDFRRTAPEKLKTVLRYRVD